MGTAFATKSARVFVAEEYGHLGRRLSDALRKNGFLEVIVVKSAGDIFEALEHRDCDWIIMSGFLDQPINAYQVLKTIAEHSRLRRVRMSLIVAPEEERYLGAAFQNGLMSWHARAAIEADCDGEIERLFEMMKFNNWTMPLVASEYFRKHRNAIGDFASLLAVEKGLLELFPGSLPVLMRYGETQLRSGRMKEGLATLHQACVIDERAMKATESIIDTYAPSRSRLGFDISKIIENNILGIKTCVIIDPDVEVIGALKELLTLSGVPEIHTFEDGGKAWHWLSTHPEPDLILQEWRIPGLSGAWLLQRLRHHGYTNVPVNVISSVIRPEESHLLRELSVANVIAKPFDSQGLFKSLVWTAQQHVFPTEQNSLQQKLRRLLQSDHVREAELIKEAFLSDPRIKASGKKTVEANFAFGAGANRLARDYALEALKLQGDTLCLLNLIGKCLLRLGDPESAGKAFHKALSMSPMNIENLCLLAIAYHDSYEAAESETMLKKARQFDPGSQMVAETECLLTLIAGDPSRAKGLLEELSNPQNIVTAALDRSLAYSRIGHYEEEHETLRRLDEVLPPRLIEAKERVAFSRAQAFARRGDWAASRTALATIAIGRDAALSQRAVDLKGRIDAAEAGKSRLSYYELRTTPGSDGRSRSLAQASEESYRGELCLRGIYNPTAEELKDSARLLENPPAYLDKSDRRTRSVQKEL